MKKTDWNEVLDHLDPALVEEYVTQKARLEKRTKPKKAWLRLGVIAACVALIFAACILVPMMRRNGNGGGLDELPNASTVESTSDIRTPMETTDNNYVGCYIAYIFYSIDDLTTYVTTGSTDLKDYKYEPDYPLTQTPSPEKIESRGGYIPISDYFTIDESLFDSVEVGFSLYEGSVHYFYVFDNNLYITMDYVGNDPSETTLSHYAKRQGLSMSEDSIVVFDPNAQIENGLSVRSYGNCDVVYVVKNSLKRAAYILIDGFYIMISNTAASDYFGTVEQDYAEFMTSPKYAPFAALFADDQETFEAAVMSMVEKAAAEK